VHPKTQDAEQKLKKICFAFWIPEFNLNLPDEQLSDFSSLFTSIIFVLL